MDNEIDLTNVSILASLEEGKTMLLGFVPEDTILYLQLDARRYQKFLSQLAGEGDDFTMLNEEGNIVYRGIHLIVPPEFDATPSGNLAEKASLILTVGISLKINSRSVSTVFELVCSSVINVWTELGNGRPFGGKLVSLATMKPTWKHSCVDSAGRRRPSPSPNAN